jgi:hypothetical protein
MSPKWDIVKLIYLTMIWSGDMGHMSHIALSPSGIFLLRFLKQPLQVEEEIRLTDLQRQRLKAEVILYYTGQLTYSN